MPNICAERAPTISNADGNLCIRMETFPNNNLEEALAVTSRLIPEPAVSPATNKFISTGVRSAALKDEISKLIGNRTMETALEFGCIQSSLRLLCSLLPLHQGFHRFDDVTVDMIIAQARECAKAVTIDHDDTKGEFKTSDTWIQYIETFNRKFDDSLGGKKKCRFIDLYPDMFPCMTLNLGSACGFQLIKSKDEFKLLDLNSRSGKTLLGLGSLLTGAQTFDELLGLAEKGTSAPLDVISTDLMSAQPDDMMNMFPRDVLIFSFAKAQGKTIADFRREDLARGVLVMVVNDIVQSAVAYAAAYGARCVFVSGSMASHPLIRREIMRAFCIRRCYNAQFEVELFFQRHSGYVGTLGAIMQWQ